MILVDTSIWIDHMRQANPTLVGLLHDLDILTHPFVTGELLCGSIANRDLWLEHMDALPQAPVVNPQELLHFMQAHKLYGLGLGYVDMHLLASVYLKPRTLLWTKDKRLAATAKTLGVLFAP